MHQNKLLTFLIACLMALPAICMAKETPLKGPRAFVPTPVHQFAPVVEGTTVTHAFVLRNQGTEPLKILDLKSG